MNWTTILTVLGTSFATVAPQLITAIPSQYQPILTGSIALVGLLYHLYQPVPNQPIIGSNVK